MSEKMLVSVIIPVYNVAPYLREALESAAGQTYAHLEIIVVDDGSNDGSEEICDRFAAQDSRVTVLHQTNQGLSAARNAGLERMSGDVVAFLDSDDAFSPDMIASMLEVMRRENADMVLCRYQTYRTEGPFARSTPLDQHAEPNGRPGLYDRTEALRALVDGGINHMVWNRIYRKELWKTIRFPVGRNYEDLDTTFRVLDLCNKAWLMDEVFYLRRIQRPGSITSTHSARNLQDRLLSLSHLEAYVRAHIPELFTPEHHRKVLELKFTKLLREYARARSLDPQEDKKLRSDILALGEEMEMETYDPRVRAAWRMIRCCPRLLKITYPLIAWER